MTRDEFYAQRANYIRLTGCKIYLPDASRRGYHALDGGRTVFVKKLDSTTGLAVVQRQVVSVCKIDHVRWNVIQAEPTNNTAA